ncbi:hypothetical protein MMU07_05100 [Aquiflexum sp. LQ15W]|uniref:hypothetical protein n=1 Tax=Cognataquiflexum nitidum TaxID=2922272 RepID=UPI001F1413B1|nr:hypothetical protein [Cognataquiflexum nitidum]MCH6198942.1 hypothetical protein [Cognataquiflexum nitidum]
MSEIERKTTSKKRELTLDDLTESEKALHDEIVSWFQSFRITVPTKMILDHFTKVRESNC